MQIITILMKIKTFFTWKKIIWTSVILLVFLGGYFIFGKKDNAGNIQTDFVKRQDIEKTVLATGQVISSTDLSLSFPASGIVKRILIKEGDVVRAGQLLAELDMNDLAAQLQSAEASLILAKQQAFSSKNNLSNVISQQKALVASAYRTLLSSGLVAVPDSDSYTVTPPTISGAYEGTEGTYKIVIDKKNISDADFQLRTYNLERLDNVKVEESEPTRLGTYGLFVSFPDDMEGYNNTQWYVTIPNTKSVSYLLNYNAYQQALKAQEKAVADAEANVGFADSSSVVDAQIAQAQATVDSIIAKIKNTRIVAPMGGTITEVDIKVGELAQASAEVMKLLNVEDLHTEALISESDIASVVVGQVIDNTFDALGPDKHFETTVLTVNPASTVISGVVNYKITGSLEKILEVKPGMTANMTIKVAEKQNVLVVQSSAVINKDGKHFVRVIDDPKKKTYTEVEVTIGLDADGGLMEITSGLSEGQEIVTYIK